MTATPLRIAAFALVSVGLVGLALALAPGSPPAPVPARAAQAAVAHPVPSLLAAARRRKSHLDVAARAFVGAFLRYEAGDLPAPVARSLGRLTTAGFGRELLGAPPRQIGGRPTARIIAVETAFLDPAADRALVRGVARRADGPEELSFVFVLRGGRWLAVRAAE
ncbi:MAG TPA: hypothetical protein VFJ57_12100 [Solirubrobacterales bacterium]|nr:hypothetical protein [Solirubrobacterales bacterium]